MLTQDSPLFKVSLQKMLVESGLFQAVTYFFTVQFSCTPQRSGDKCSEAASAIAGV